MFEEIWLVLKRAMLELLEEEKPRTFEIYDDCTMIGVGSKCKPINIEQVRE